MPEAVGTVLDKAGSTLADVDLVVAHQANDPASGRTCHVSYTIVSTVSAGMVGLRPRRSAITPTVSTPPERNLSHHRITVFGHVPNRRAVARIDTPSAGINNARA